MIAINRLSSRASRVSYASSARREEACCDSLGHGEAFARQASNTGVLDHGILSPLSMGCSARQGSTWYDFASLRLRFESQEDVVSCFGGGSPADSPNSSFSR
jgi:hypothetical protein